MSEYLQGKISERIRDLRQKNDLTQEQLADILGIHKATISRIENGNPTQMPAGQLIFDPIFSLFRRNPIHSGAMVK